MAWWKREILFILSAFVFIFTSCENPIGLSKENRLEKQTKTKESWTKKELITEFFIHVQNWNSYSIQKIDSLGNVISQRDSSLLFLPYHNDYEKNAFIFAANNKNDFQDFEESEFLKKSLTFQHSSSSYYKVWRGTINELQLLDLSIEPHPTLKWIFVVRLRMQE